MVRNNDKLSFAELVAWPQARDCLNVDVVLGEIEPGLLGAIAKIAKDGQAASKGLDGHLVTRVAMGVDVLARLHQQIQQVLVTMRDARQKKTTKG